MDYEKAYLKYTQGFLKCIPDISQEYSNCNAFEKCVIAMRKQNWTYSQIQSALGMPSKKSIRAVLLEHAPELIDNSVKKISKYSSIYSELYNILSKTDKTKWNIWGSEMECFIKDHIIYFDGDPLSDWAETEQQQILNAIKQQCK